MADLLMIYFIDKLRKQKRGFSVGDVTFPFEVIEKFDLENDALYLRPDGVEGKADLVRLEFEMEPGKIIVAIRKDKIKKIEKA